MKIAIVNCFDTYEHRVILLQDYFRKQSHEVVVIASDYRHFQKKYRSKAPEGFVLVHARAYHRNLSVDRMASHIKFARDAFRTLASYTPDLVWVLAPPNSLIKEAAGYRRVHPETKCIIDLIDMWPETMPMAHLKKLPPFTYWRNLRERYLHSADAIVTECNLYQTIISKRNPVQKFYTLYLAKAQSEKGNVIAAGETVREKVILPPTDRWALCYLGSINHIIDVSCISEILYSLPERDKMPIVHVIGDGEQRERLLEAIRATGASAVFHGKVFEQHQKQQILDGCHFGLNVMKDSVFVGLTMKSLDYFAAGLPILNTIKGDTWALVESEDIGINYQRTSQARSGYIQANKFDTECMRYRDNVREMFQRYFTVQAFEKKVSEIMADVFHEDVG